ncbi:methyltransferase [soil metagenome]
MKRNFSILLLTLATLNNYAMEQNPSNTNNIKKDTTQDTPEHQLKLRQQLIDFAVINMLKARGLQIVAEYNIADHLTNGPKSSHELADSCGLHQSSLHRLLSMLASHGIFTQDEQGKFSLTELSSLLVSNAPYSIGAYTKTPDNYWWDTIRDLDHSIKTGESSFEKKHSGTTFWQALGDSPEHGQRFAAGMGNYSQPENEVFASIIDCTPFKTVVDVGGGKGDLVKALLTRNKQLRGTLFDLDHVTKQAEPADRLQIASGDFFKSVPAGADAYILKRVLLDWDDAKATEIVHVIRTAMHPESKLFIMDGIITGQNQRDVAKDFDILMLGLFAGKHRTQNDFETMLSKVDLEISSIKPTSFGISIIETSPRNRIQA